MNECSINHNAEKKTNDLIIGIIKGEEERTTENAEIARMQTVLSERKGRTSDIEIHIYHRYEIRWSRVKQLHRSHIRTLVCSDTNVRLVYFFLACSPSTMNRLLSISDPKCWALWGSRRVSMYVSIAYISVDRIAMDLYSGDIYTKERCKIAWHCWQFAGAFPSAYSHFRPERGA
jgi:hypothetical protein